MIIEKEAHQSLDVLPYFLPMLFIVFQKFCPIYPFYAFFFDIRSGIQIFSGNFLHNLHKSSAAESALAGTHGSSGPALDGIYRVDGNSPIEYFFNGGTGYLLAAADDLVRSGSV